MSDTIDKTCKAVLCAIKTALDTIKGVLDNILSKLNDVYNDFLAALNTIIARLTSILSSVEGIEDQTDKLTFDGSSYLNVHVQAGGGGGSDVFGDNANRNSVSQSATSVLLKAANTNRKEIYIRNDGEKKNDYLYISYVNPSTLNEAIKIYQDEILIEDKYRGAIYGIWSVTGTGAARVTEVTL